MGRKSVQVTVFVSHSSPDLLPCPFCGSKDIIFFTAHVRNVSRVYCNNCAVNTGDRDSETVAVNAWNKRSVKKSKKNNG